MSQPIPEIHGTCQPRYARVRGTFAAGFASQREIGAAVAITVDGEPVVDLWAGHADPARTRRWQRDTIVHLYSVSKGMTALCAHRLIERGALDLDVPVARYWPEFAGGQGRDLRPLAALPPRRPPGTARALEPWTLYDWDAMCRALAGAEPCLPPGQLAYHPVTYGWLVGELVRRIDGRSLGRFFREEVALPLGADLHIGLGPAEQKRAADITPLQPPPELVSAFADAPAGELPLIALAFINPSGNGDHNSPDHRRAEIPAINAHGTAAALARIYGALASGGDQDGVHVLAPASIERARSEQAHAADPLLHVPIRMGLGYWLSHSDAPGFAFGPNPGAFGHPGTGGSLGFADPIARVGFGYVTNRMGSGIAIDERPQALIDAFYAS